SGRTMNGRRTGSSRSKSASCSGSPLRGGGGPRISHVLLFHATAAEVGFVTVNRPEKLNAVSIVPRREPAARRGEALGMLALRRTGRRLCVGSTLPALL